LFEFEGLPTGLVLVDRKRKVLAINPAARQLLGLSETSPTGTTMAADSPLSPLLPVIEATAATEGDPAPIDLTVSRYGVNRTLRCSAHRCTGDRSELAVHILDVSSRKLLEDHVKRVDSMATIGMLAAGLTHILHSPVNLATTYVDLMLKDPTDSVKVKFHGERVLGALKRASEASHRLLWLVNKRVSSRESCDLHQILQNACNLLDRHLSLGSHELVGELNAEQFETMGDPALFELLFVCMIIHIVEVVPEPGILRVVTSSQAPIFKVAFQHSAMKDALGHEGIEEQEFRDSDPRQILYGLVIGRRFIENVGGAIDFAPDADGFPTLTVLLPVLKGDARKSPQE
jgi:hypothetical protein